MAMEHEYTREEKLATLSLLGWRVGEYGIAKDLAGEVVVILYGRAGAYNEGMVVTVPSSDLAYDALPKYRIDYSSTVTDADLTVAFERALAYEREHA